MQARDVKELLVECLRVPRFDTRIIWEITKARRDDVATRLMVLEERTVKVVDSRMSELPIFLSLVPPWRIVCSPGSSVY